MNTTGDVRSGQQRRELTCRTWLVLLGPLLVLLAACTSSSTSTSTTDATATAQIPVATSAPIDQTEPTASVEQETPPSTESPTPASVETPEADAVLACQDVPAFSSADTVSIACAGSYAVSPELFASNAGWYLFEDIGGAWVEIDYARTCCEAGDPSFSDLLQRNGLDASTQGELCAASGLADDPFSGCAIAFEETWLRVNGLEDNDFGAATDVVLDSIAAAFGQPVEVVDLQECGAGPMTIARFPDFTVQFQDGAFVGWFYESSTPTLTTPSGVTVGLSESDLRIVYDGVDIFEDTLGREFFFEVPAGWIGGFISDTDATVTALYAGTNCFFR